MPEMLKRDPITFYLVLTLSLLGISLGSLFILNSIKGLHWIMTFKKHEVKFNDTDLSKVSWF